MTDTNLSIEDGKETTFEFSTSARKKILIVDDSLVNRKILEKTLSQDYSLTEAENGQEALDALRNSPNKFALILLDIIMPVMDGYAFLKEQQADENLANIPVVVTTQKEGEADEIKALACGAADFISKPYKPQIIKHRIANILRLQETAAMVNATQKDAVTGVYNKEFFYKRAEAILNQARGRKFDIVCCDIERFKLVNDLFGMKIGDALLKHLAGVMRRDIADKGICGRVGIDKFACLVPHREDYCSLMFDKAIMEINEFPITVSINVCYGIYVIDNLNAPISTMCDRALLSCNSIKGKYDVHFAYYDDTLMQEMLAEQSILDEMKTAIKEKQFEVYYQPKYDITAGKVAGAEALVRWRHPQKGFISPAEFIPLFEKNGFITELDIYVWDTVCSNLHEWISSGNKYVPVSVNVSRADIYNPDLTNIFLGLIKKYELSPSQMHLEITETAYTENSNQLIGVVKKLKKLGFVIEMDDFGSGYSSLNMLSELPLDILKLDMKFIQNETAKNSSKSILSFVISLAKWLNLLVIAEGVETKEQLDLLRNMDCNYVQGYYYAKPMPREEFEEHLLNNQVAEANEAPKMETVGSEDVSIIKSSSDRVMMIVDDVELNRVILAEIFSEYYTIVEADNGRTAYEYILENHENVDIILLDLVMPIMDGFQLLEKIKADGETKNIPVVITSQASDDSEALALEMGAADFISKPYNAKVALRRVNNVLATNKVIKLEEEKAIYQRMQEMERKAKTDALTGLYNRAELEAQVNAFFSTRDKPNSLFIILDIDNFKLVNDRLGHAKGDEAIQKVAEILCGCFRNDDIVCRMGGDEFSVFLRGTFHPKDLSARLESLCAKLRFVIDDMSISCSMGACTSPDCGNDYQTLYQNADMALMTAKRLGKNQYQVFGGDTPLPSHVLFRNMDWLMDEASDAVVVCDAGDYDLLYLNDVACGIAGKSKKECVGKKCYEALWNRSTPCEHCIDTSRMSREYSEREASPEGTDRSFIIKGKLVDWGGKPARIQYIQDNTQKAAIARALANISEDRKKLLDLMPGGIFRYAADEGEAFDFVNKNMLKMLGYTKKEFDDKFQNKFSNMVWHEDRARVKQEIQSQMSSGDTDECDYRIEKGNGELCWVHDAGRLVYDENGKAWFYVTIVDITQRQQMQARLEDEREKLQLALSHSGLQHCEHDLLTDKALNGVKGANCRVSDVDELKRMEEAAKEQQVRYEVALKSSGINVWEYDILEDVLSVVSNSARIKQNCFTIENYIASTVENGYVREDSLEAFYSIFERLKKGEKEVTEDVWYKTTDEAGWWCERVIYTTVFDANGKPVKAFGAGRDVTREKEATKKFDEEMYYRAAMQDANIGALKINLTQNTIVEGKSHFAALMDLINGKDADLYFSKTPEYITGEENKENYKESFNRRTLLGCFNRGDYALSMEFTRLFDNSKIYWIRYNVHLMRNPETKDVFAFVIANDITDEKVMETIMQTVTRTEYDFFVMVDGSTNSAADYTTNDKERLFTEDQAFEARNEELIRKSVCPEDVDMVVANCKIDNVLKETKDGRVYKFNFSMREENGEIRRKQLQLTLIDTGRKTFLMTRIDVNSVFIEQQIAQQRLEAALETAKKASHVKTDFLARMSHDMRTPMNGILGLLNLTMEEPSLTEPVRNNLIGIYDSSQYLLSLINDTLDMNKIESNKLVLNPQIIKADSLVSNLVTFVTPLANEKDIELQVIPINAELEYIKADTLRLQQIFVNILSNSIKFTPAGGKIEFIIECLKRENGIAYDRIVVRDNGVGMSKEFLPKLFEPFEQEQKLITSNYSGTGLGMSIVKRLVELMGGTIEAKSQQGVGTEIIINISFERVYDYVPTEPIADFNLDSLTGRRVLLCEDHPLNAQIATKLLEKKGMAVELAKNGEAAVEMFAAAAEKYYDAVLMDIRMPIMDGIEATRHIRALKRLDSKTVPIIAMTANAFDEDVQKSLDAGMNAHLAKPIEPKKLFDTLAGLFSAAVK